MTDASSVRSLNCPNCGAPVEFPEGQASVRCRFCDSSIERSVAALTDADDANVIRIDAAGFQGAGSPTGPARRFVIKMRDGQPVVIEMGKGPAAAPTTEQMFNAARAANAAAGAARPRPRPSVPAPAKRSTRLGCLVWALALVAGVGIIVVIIFASNPQAGLIVQQLLAGKFDEAFANSQTLGANILLSQSGVLAPGPNEGPDEALVLAIEYPASGGSKQNRVLAVSTSTRQLLWQSEPLDPDLYGTPILYNDDLVFIVSGQQLVALRRSDGVKAWTAEMADQISLNTCRDCFRLVNDRLAALTDDGTLQLFDAATGQSEWQVTAQQDSPRGLYVLGGRLGFMDRDADAHGVLRAFDLATGKEQSVKPACGTTDLGLSNSDWTTPLLPAPDGTAVYMAFGYGPACVQRWDARTLELAWSSELPQNLSTSIESVLPVLSGNMLFMASGHAVAGVSTDQGDVSAIVNDEGFDFTIEGTHGGDLLLQALRRRGSQRYEIWDVDAANGQTRWTFDLGDEPPLDPAGIIDDNTPVWMTQPTEAGLRLVHFKSAADNKSHAILNETLDWQTGQSGGQTETRLNLPTIIFDAPSWTAWKNNTLWMVIENELLGFDAAGNKVVYRWP